VILRFLEGDSTAVSGALSNRRDEIAQVDVWLLLAGNTLRKKQRVPPDSGIERQNEGRGTPLRA
jgi:hypothetical protein